MVVSKQLKKQIIIEVIALIFLVGVIIYAFFAIQKSNENKVTSQDGMVIVIDDSAFKGLKKASDGQGLEEKGTTYTLTNNNSLQVKYKLVLDPDVHNEEILKLVRVSVDDLYVDDLTALERLNGGYVIADSDLDAGFTKIHLIKMWYKLDSSEKVASEKINFEYRFVKLEE